MLDIRFIRDNKDFVKERLAFRNFKETGCVDEIISLDETVKITKRRIEDAQSQINSYSTEISRLVKNGAQDQAETLKGEVVQLKTLLGTDKPALEQTENALLSGQGIWEMGRTI